MLIICVGTFFLFCLDFHGRICVVQCFRMPFRTCSFMFSPAVDTCSCRWMLMHRYLLASQERRLLIASLPDVPPHVQTKYTCFVRTLRPPHPRPRRCAVRSSPPIGRRDHRADRTLPWTAPRPRRPLTQVPSPRTRRNFAARSPNALARSPAVVMGAAMPIGLRWKIGIGSASSLMLSCYPSSPICPSATPGGRRFSRRGGAACSTNPSSTSTRASRSHRRKAAEQSG
jgi:hypothetical protein